MMGLRKNHNSSEKRGGGKGIVCSPQTWPLGQFLLTIILNFLIRHQSILL